MDKISEIIIYKDNLVKTDWVVTKIAEAQALGENIELLKQKYAEILSMRRQWRERINALESP